MQSIPNSLKGECLLRKEGWAALGLKSRNDYGATVKVRRFDSKETPSKLIAGEHLFVSHNKSMNERAKSEKNASERKKRNAHKLKADSNQEQADGLSGQRFDFFGLQALTREREGFAIFPTAALKLFAFSMNNMRPPRQLFFSRTRL